MIGSDLILQCLQVEHKVMNEKCALIVDRCNLLCKKLRENNGQEKGGVCCDMRIRESLLAGKEQ